MKPLNCAMLAMISLVAASAASGVTYKASLLHPLNGFVYSEGVGVSGTSQVGVGYVDERRQIERALLWHETAQSVVNLHPTGFTNSRATDAAGDVQVGFGETNAGSDHALLWTGTAESVVDLHLGDAGTSQAWGAWENTQVGNYNGHAAMWHGTADSVVDLHPVERTLSTALDVSEDSQVGYAKHLFDPNERAFLWHGTADSAVDLHPAGFEHSRAEGVSGGFQVGWATRDEVPYTHAVLWNGTAASAVDLSPGPQHFLLNSVALDVSGNTQVGYGYFYPTGGSIHALLWHGTAESVVDLDPFLDDLPIHTGYSVATGIDPSGRIIGYGTVGDDGYVAVMWTPVPEPSRLALFSCVLIAAIFTRRPRR